VRRQVIRACRVVAALALAALAGIGSAWSGQSGGLSDVHVGGFYFRAGLMEASGDGGFTISGIDSNLGQFTSVLDFSMDGTYFLLEAGIDELGSGFGLHLRYGTSSDLGDTVTDTDYAWQITSSEYIKSVSQSNGENSFLTFDVSYRIYESAGAGATQPVRLEVFGGYHLQDTSFEVHDVNTVITEARPVNYFTAGAAATYDMDFRGVRLGLRGEIAIGSSGALSGHVAFLPFLEADGFGQWILREKTLDHDASGWGLDLLVRYEHAFTENIRVWGGLGYTRLEGNDGVDSQYRFSGALIGRADLETIESEYTFAMIGGEIRF
jgi:hypothetical protein